MNAAVCSRESHAAIKASPALWASCQLIGYQRVEADDVGPAETLELRNTPCCGSTLCVTVEGGAL